MLDRICIRILPLIQTKEALDLPHIRDFRIEIHIVQESRGPRTDKNLHYSVKVSFAQTIRERFRIKKHCYYTVLAAFDIAVAHHTVFSLFKFAYA
jgi:hypothetical protein